MTSKLRIFVSSVQKELEDERLIIQNLLNTDAFLSAHCVPVLYEFEPASPDDAAQACIQLVDACQVYLLVVGIEYGTLEGDLSITHLEFRRALAKKRPILAFIKGPRTRKRAAGTDDLLKEVDAARLKYKRFGNVVELQKEVRAALVKLLHDRFGIEPTSAEDEVAEQTIEATSTFETKCPARLRWEDLDHEVLRRLVTGATSRDPGGFSEADLLNEAVARGLVWHDGASGIFYATAAGIVLLARDPSAVFPQCRILADAYRTREPDGDPSDHQDLRAPMPIAVEQAMAFVDRNTRHPMRVVGLNRVRLDEYPTEALREALVNAVAHRQYEDAGRKILLEVFADRVVVSSPGSPPAPITLPKLRKGSYKPCSRNPNIAQSLSFFHRIEERGRGFRRMRTEMLNHGLDPPVLNTDTGYFQLILPGPGDAIERLRIPETRLVVTPAVEAQLNARQKRILVRALESGSVTRRWCVAEFKIVNDTAGRDLKSLVDLGLLVPQGRGRAARYVPSLPSESTDKRPT